MNVRNWILLFFSFCYTECSAFAVSRHPHKMLVGVDGSRKRSRRHHDCLYSARYDNLISGLAEISLGASLGVLWSEYSVLTTGCGPADLSDFLERLCYQIDIVAAGMFLFTRIGLGGQVTTILNENYPMLQDFTLLQVKWAEWLAFATVFGAIVALAFQVASGAQMDGLSGIDVDMCRNMRDFQSLY